MSSPNTYPEDKIQIFIYILKKVIVFKVKNYYSEVI
jgi:hypothetical protein